MKKLIFLATLIMFFGCSSPIKRSYPAHWWTAADKASAPDWEILPQEAKPGEVILSKRNELGILSNFSKTPFYFEGTKYNSIEGFWQMMKYPEGPNDERIKAHLKWPITRIELSKLSSFEAKKYGSIASKNMKSLGINWVSYKGKKIIYKEKIKGEHYKIIKAAMTEKLRQNPKVRKILLSTGDLKLIPDHHQKEVPPAWKYNEIWMDLRDNHLLWTSPVIKQ